MSAQWKRIDKETSAIYSNEIVIAWRDDERNYFNGTFTVD